MDTNLEKRFTPVELRADFESRIIKGTAIVFNSRSQNLGGFVEEIKANAVSQDLINKSDIVMLYNHNQESGILARSKNGKGSLNITINDKGVDFEFKAKNTNLGNEILESVKNGDLDACSFAFRIAESGDQWDKIQTDLYLRTINKFDSLHDFSIVVCPAYDQTSVNSRSTEKLKELRQNELLEFEQSNILINEEKQRIQFELDQKEKQWELYYNRMKSKYLSK